MERSRRLILGGEKAKRMSLVFYGSVLFLMDVHIEMLSFIHGMKLRRKILGRNRIYQLIDAIEVNVIC